MTRSLDAAMSSPGGLSFHWSYRAIYSTPGTKPSFRFFDALGLAEKFIESLPPGSTCRIDRRAVSEFLAVEAGK